MKITELIRISKGAMVGCVVAFCIGMVCIVFSDSYKNLWMNACITSALGVMLNKVAIEQLTKRLKEVDYYDAR